jgi:hypothetical protein
MKGVRGRFAGCGFFRKCRDGGGCQEENAKQSGSLGFHWI